MVGRGGTPSLALVILFTMKNFSPKDIRHGRKLRFAVRRAKAKAVWPSVSYKFDKHDFALGREIIVTRNDRSVRRSSKSKQEATC